MSNEAMTWAVQPHGVSPGAKLLLVILANIADKAGVAFPGRALLATDCETTTKTVSENMARLEAAGLVGRTERRRQNGSRTSDWIVLAPRAADRGPMLNAELAEYPEEVVELAKGVSGNDSSPNDSDLGQVTNSGRPEPPEEPPVINQSENVRARLRVNGQPVKPELWDLTEAVLAEFNLQAGQRLGALTESGEPSENAKRIYGRVRQWPSMTLGEHSDLIRRTLASRWWGDGTPGVGVCYGKNVFEDNRNRTDDESTSGSTRRKSEPKPSFAPDRFVKKSDPWGPQEF